MLKISRPRMSDVADPNQFFNRKGFYASKVNVSFLRLFPSCPRHIFLP
jgi:hypothetical protein